MLMAVTDTEWLRDPKTRQRRVHPLGSFPQKGGNGGAVAVPSRQRGRAGTHNRAGRAQERGARPLHVTLALLRKAENPRKALLSTISPPSPEEDSNSSSSAPKDSPPRLPVTDSDVEEISSSDDEQILARLDFNPLETDPSFVESVDGFRGRTADIEREYTLMDPEDADRVIGDLVADIEKEMEQRCKINHGEDDHVPGSEEDLRSAAFEVILRGLRRPLLHLQVLARAETLRSLQVLPEFPIVGDKTSFGFFKPYPWLSGKNGSWTRATWGTATWETIAKNTAEWRKKLRALFTCGEFRKLLADSAVRAEEESDLENDLFEVLTATNTRRVLQFLQLADSYCRSRHERGGEEPIVFEMRPRGDAATALKDVDLSAMFSGCELWRPVTKDLMLGLLSLVTRNSDGTFPVSHSQSRGALWWLMKWQKIFDGIFPSISSKTGKSISGAVGQQRALPRWLRNFAADLYDGVGAAVDDEVGRSHFQPLRSFLSCCSLPRRPRPTM